jgi:hypothetical protein
MREKKSLRMLKNSEAQFVFFSSGEFYCGTKVYNLRERKSYEMHEKQTFKN